MAYGLQDNTTVCAWLLERDAHGTAEQITPANLLISSLSD